MRLSKAAPFLVSCAMMTVGCTSEEPPPAEGPCAVGAGDVQLCTRQVGPSDATSTVIMLPVGPGIASSYLGSLAQVITDQNEAAAYGVELPTVRVITYDPRGTGTTNAPSPPSYMLSDYANDLEAVRQKVGAGPIHIFAQGWSALVAYHYLRVYPQNVRSLIFVGGYAPRVGPNSTAEKRVSERIEHLQSQTPPLIPNPLPADNGDDCNPTFAAKLPAYFFYWPGTPPEELRSTACHLSVKNQTAGAILNTPYDYGAEAAAYPGPSLVIIGKNDPHGPELGDAVAASLATSAPTNIVLPSSGHYPWFDAQAQEREFETLVWSFLAANP